MAVAALNAVKQPGPKRLSPMQKAAVIIGILGKDTVKPLFDHLEEENLRSFGQSMATLGDVDKVTIDATIEEFLKEVASRESMLDGNIAQALDILTGNISDSAISRLRFELDQNNSESIWRKIAEIDEQMLADCLILEHPQVAAIVMTKLRGDRASAVLEYFAIEQAQGIIAAISRLGTLDEKTVDAIGRTIAEKFLVASPAGKTAGGPADLISAILNNSIGQTRDQILDHLAGFDSDLGQKVRQKMFMFQDIATRIDKKDISKITRIADQGTLLKALAGAADNAPDVREMILGNISTRLAEQLNEALSELGAVKARDSDLAQTEIVKIIRKLHSDGELTFVEAEEA